MECCKYERGGGGSGGWHYAPHYAPYAHYYAAPAHDPYARYYQYDYGHHAHHAERSMPMDYGGYPSKDLRNRRTHSRRDARAHTPLQHISMPPTPPLESNMNGGGGMYFETSMWSHYQMGMMGGGGWGSGLSSWSRAPMVREQMRYPSDLRNMKGHLYGPNACATDGLSSPYPTYEDSRFVRENSSRQRSTPEYHQPVGSGHDVVRAMRERYNPEPRPQPVEEKKPPVVPLPAFQQAFGSTEIGKFAEAFSRTEPPLEELPSETFFESYSEWEQPSEPQWPTPASSLEIKCEESF